MKREDLEKLGLSKEQIDSILNLHHGEMTPVKDDLKKTQDDLKLAQGKVTETEGKLKELEGLDKDGYEKKLKELEEALKQKDTEHAAQLADRDFSDMLKESITAAKGKNTKAITALLDMDALKASKNQKDDIAAALKALTEAEDSKMLFGEPEAQPVGTGNLIGTVTKTSSATDDAAMRAAMGLPPVSEATTQK